MLLFNKEDGDIFNLDNITRIYPDDYYIRYNDNRSNNNIMVICDDSEQAFKVIEWIYHRMTFGNGNVTLDLEEFREPEKSIWEETEAMKDVNEEK